MLVDAVFVVRKKMNLCRCEMIMYLHVDKRDEKIGTNPHNRTEECGKCGDLGTDRFAANRAIMLRAASVASTGQ
jgi:hypothetical protein